MGNLLTPPSTGIPFVQQTPGKGLDLTPVWRKWFIDLTQIINRSGGTDGSISGDRLINTVPPLSGGGDLTEDRTLEFVPVGLSGDVQINNGGSLGSITGLSVVIITAKRTGGGAEGSMTFTNGILTAQVQAT